MILKIYKSDISLDSRARGEWCRLPYPNHPLGCPNFGKKKTCPPFSKPLKEVMKPPFFLVIRSFDLEAHAKRMKKLHPNWSDRQARCLLYWQSSVRKKLVEEARAFVDSQNKDLIFIENPEANGVNIFKTCKNMNIILERNPKEIVWKVMLVGKRLECF